MYIQNVIMGLFAAVFVIGAICTLYAVRTRLGGRRPAVTARAAGAAAVLNAAAAAAAVYSGSIFACVHGISNRSGDELGFGSLAVLAQVCYAIGWILLELRRGDGNDGRFASASLLALSLVFFG